MRYYSGQVVDQEEQPPSRRRGRPRKWPSEDARRAHEAAKRRLRNWTQLTSEEFNDVVWLTALSEDLQRRLTSVTKELGELRQEYAWVRRENEQLKERARAAASGPTTNAGAPVRPRQPPAVPELPEPGLRAPAEATTAAAPPSLSRSQRRAAERAAKREQHRRQR